VTRALAPSIAEDNDRPDSPHAHVWFVEIDHPNIVGTVRVVSDIFEYEIDGKTYAAAPFQASPVTDSDAPPSAEIVMENISRQVSAALENDTAGTRATITAVAHSSADFDLSVEPRVPLAPGSPPEVYAFRQFELNDVSADVAELKARISLVDIATEPWPSLRATSDRFPGLFA